MPIHPKAFFRALDDANANLNCLSCGSERVAFAAERAAFVELGDNGMFRIDDKLGLAAGMEVALRVCRKCGYVQAYSISALEERNAEPL